MCSSASRNTATNPTWASAGSGIRPMGSSGHLLLAAEQQLLCSKCPLLLLWCEVGACNHNKFPWARWHWNTQLIPNHGVFFQTVPVLLRAGSPLAGACINSWLCLSFCLHLFCGPFFTTLLCVGFVPHCIPIFFFFHLSSLFF